MELQLALDTVTLEEGAAMLEGMRGVVDIIEVGTPMIMRYGVKAVESYRRKFPDFKILADGKIMDGGAFEAGMLLEAGADIVTVLAAASDLTIKAVAETAKKYHACVMADLIEVKDYVTRAKEVRELGVDLVCVHNGSDIKNSGKLDYLKQLREVNLAVGKEHTVMAGGVKPENIAEIVREGAAVTVCGEYIVTHREPAAAAKTLKSYFSL